MNKSVRKVVVVGGGTAGWMSAILLKKILGVSIDLELVESNAIGIIGVGEATIPPILHVNKVLGIDEAQFMRETNATFKLAIRFENWEKLGKHYYHTFGSPGQNHAFCQFHHYWLRSQKLGYDADLWDFDLNYHCCEEGSFARVNEQNPALQLPYAYHFDSSLYGQFLRKESEKIGVVRTEGTISDVNLNPESGYVENLKLEDGRQVDGDLFIDCSGARGLLIQKHLQTGYEDWGHWLPCDKAVAVQSERLPYSQPYTRSIAHSAGWQWMIPLQHRTGNGFVYSSRYYSDDEATSLLLGNLETKTVNEPRVIPFRIGRALKQWNRNVVAVGLSSGFLEPLESTSIYLVQSAIVRLIHLFPNAGVTSELIYDYNRQAKQEMELIRDFIILHYHVNQRDDSQFWKDLRRMSVPDRLARRIESFKTDGRLFQDQYDIFLEPSWLQVMLGQGVTPQDYHPVADSLTDNQLLEWMKRLAAERKQIASSIPNHDEFVARFVA